MSPAISHVIASPTRASQAPRKVSSSVCRVMSRCPSRAEGSDLGGMEVGAGRVARLARAVTPHG